MATFPSPNDGGEVGVKRCAATLEKEEWDELAGIRRKGPQRPRQALNAPLLLKCGEGGFNPGIRQRLNRRSASLEVLRAEPAGVPMPHSGQEQPAVRHGRRLCEAETPWPAT